MTETKAAHPDPGRQRRKQQRTSRNRLLWAAGISLLFHLSMITFFEIGVVYPRDDIRFYQVQIISAPESTAAPAEASSQGEALSLGRADSYDLLPRVALPVVEFAEMERLRVRYDTAAPMADLGGLSEQPVYTDSWARFSSELQRMSRSLRDIAFSDGEPLEVALPDPEAKRLYFRPASGFEAYIEWTGPPEDRKLLFSPPLKALWEISTPLRERHLEFVFQVDPSGRVVNVWSAEVEDADLVDDIQMTLLQYRFSPLPEYETGEGGESLIRSGTDQSGVLFIKASEAVS